jgi:hypothetical protein
MVKESRTRVRIVKSDPRIRDGLAYDTPIHLGGFFTKITGVENGVPFERWNPDPFQTVSYQPEVSAREVQITVDELHGRPPYRTGGPFLSVRVKTGLPASGAVPVGTLYTRGNDRRYVGYLNPPGNSWWRGWAQTPLAFASVSNSNSMLPDVAPYFDKAWHSAKPKLELANLYTFLKEASDIPRMLQTTAKGFRDTWYLYQNREQLINNLRFSGRTSRIMQPRWLADQFINEQFGWAPFLGDIRDFDNLYQNANREFERIRKENGKYVRKRVRVKLDSTSEVLYSVPPVQNSSYPVPCFPVSIPDEFFSSPPSWSLEETTETEVSASGKFRFYRPEFDDSMQDYDAAWKRLMRYITTSGLRPTPSNIYKAIPFTWLADWVSDLGNRIERLSDLVFDDVAAEYFFVTVHKTQTQTLSVELPFFTHPITFFFTRSFESKQRVSADSPYGFRLTWDDLSPRRLAILAALGITHN